jgi:hypothetical protein
VIRMATGQFGEWLWVCLKLECNADTSINRRTAIIVGILTFLGFLISAVTGILQVVKAFEGSRPIEVIIVGYKPGNVSAA